MDQAVKGILPTIIHVVEDPVLLQLLPNGEVGHHIQPVVAIARCQDLGHVKDQGVKDIPHTFIHAQEEVVLLVVSGEVGLHGAHVEVIVRDQDQDLVMVLVVKDIPHISIHVLVEVAL